MLFLVCFCSRISSAAKASSSSSAGAAPPLPLAIPKKRAWRVARADAAMDEVLASEKNSEAEAEVEENNAENQQHALAAMDEVAALRSELRAAELRESTRALRSERRAEVRSRQVSEVHNEALEELHAELRQAKSRTEIVDAGLVSVADPARDTIKLCQLLTHDRYDEAYTFVEEHPEACWRMQEEGGAHGWTPLAVVAQRGKAPWFLQKEILRQTPEHLVSLCLIGLKMNI